jgi:gliding motility-associated-like protein
VRVKQVPLINLGSDTGFCINDSVMLTAPAGFHQYNWSNGSSASSIYISAPGEYSVQATHMNGCVSNDTVLVRRYPFSLPMLGPDTSYCMDQLHMLSAGNYASYQWNTNESTSSIAVSTPGQYWVKVTTSNGCIGADTVNILNLYKNPADFLNDTASICAGVPVILSPLQNFEQYTWSTGHETRSISTIVDGTFVLTVTDDHGCIGKDMIEVVRSGNCPNTISFYNAFSPNGDALNPLFKPAVTGNLEKYLFAIYNRYGELIFVTTDPQAGWDGYYKGKLQSPGSFVFKCSYKFFGHPSTTKAGSFVLIR